MSIVSFTVIIVHALSTNLFLLTGANSCILEYYSYTIYVLLLIIMGTNN